MTMAAMRNSTSTASTFPKDLLIQSTADTKCLVSNDESTNI